MKRLLLFLFVFICNNVLCAEPPKTEIRAVWLTTIYGLDWPKRPARNANEVKQQQRELCEILDRLQEVNFNMVFLQVRLRGDVIYRSAIEPASKVFSGKYGVQPNYDPLAFAIEECHKRGMECHAWFVTFPVGSDRVVREQGRLSVVNKNPELCKKYNGEWYLDPGLPEARSYVRKIVREVVSSYDVDGIHLDYVRYPEKASRFPDAASYRKSKTTKSKEEWRRDNISELIAGVYDDVKDLKPWVQVSSAPLGKYERIPSAPNAGWTAYEAVHQDVKTWLAQGKQDMIVPMMYYKHNDFFPFVDNWIEISNGRFVVPGLAPYRMLKEEADWSLNDITDQIDYSRSFGGVGNAFFRCEHVLNNAKGLCDEFRNNYYKYPAMLPPLTWQSNDIPSSPEEIHVERIDNELKLSWDKSQDENHSFYTVYYSMSDSLNTEKAACILATGVRDNVLYLPVDTTDERLFTFSVSASSKYRVESIPSKSTFYYLTRFVK
jgi:Uncharacterized protein conserved in bacteria